MATFKHKGDVRVEGTLLLPNETSSKAVIINGSGEVDTSATSSVELGYVTGVTSAIQTQLNAKVDKSGGVLTSDLDAGGFKITNLGDPTVATDAATKNYVDTVAQGLSWKQYARAATTANITIATALNNGDTLDGVTLATNDRVLVKNQSAPEENGIYVVGVSPVRSSDMNIWAEVVSAAVFVSEGSVNGDKGFVCTSDAGGTLGTDPVVFAQFSNVLYTADGQGIELVGNQFQLELDGTTLSKSASGLKVNQIVDAQIASGAAIDASKLADGSVSNTEFQYINSLTSNAQDQLDGKQPLDADLTALAALATNGLIARTGAGTVAARTVTAGSNKISVSNGDGVAGNPTVDAVEANFTLNNIGGTLNVTKGGTGVNASGVTDGQLLIGNDAANGFSLAALTAGANISITNGAGTITIAASGNANDIPETSFSAANNQAVAADVTGFVFSNAAVRSFEALASVTVDATADLFEVFTLRGVQRAADWDMTVTTNGDDSLHVFSITTAGQIQYQNSLFSGFVSDTIKFRAITLAT